MRCLKELGKRFNKYPSLTFLVLATLVLFGLFVLDEKFHKNGSPLQLKDILVEAHGLFFDLIVFGVILSIYEFFKSKREKIDDFEETIEAYRNWRESEASYRIIHSIKGLNNIGKTCINLKECYFRKVDFTNLNLTKAVLDNTNFIEARIHKVNFQEADLECASFKLSFMTHSNFEKANLQGANFEEAHLAWINFRECLLGGTEFKKKQDIRVHSAADSAPACAKFNKATLSHSDLRRARLTGVDFSTTKFENVKVESIDWFKKLRDQNVRGINEVEEYFSVDPIELEDEIGKYYLIKPKPRNNAKS